MDRLVDDYVGDKIPLWEKIMDRQGTVCCAWEKTAEIRILSRFVGVSSFCAAMSAFRNGTAVVVDVYWTSVLSAVAVFPVVAHIQCQVIGISVHTEIVAEIS